MAFPLLWFILNGFGVFIEASVSPESRNVDSVESYKWLLQAENNNPNDILRRNRRLIIPRPDGLLHPSNAVFEVSTQNAPELNKKRGKGNNKKKNHMNGDSKFSRSGGNKKLKQEGKMNNPIFLRQGQSLKRLRQHMQHKKKVKQFLQKRIQEQIEQRNQNSAY